MHKQVAITNSAMTPVMAAGVAAYFYAGQGIILDMRTLKRVKICCSRLAPVPDGNHDPTQSYGYIFLVIAGYNNLSRN
jgi:hypothetical protein